MVLPPVIGAASLASVQLCVHFVSTMNGCLLGLMDHSLAYSKPVYSVEHCAGQLLNSYVSDSCCVAHFHCIKI